MSTTMKPSGIGGQSVIEGVMMRNRGRYAVAVRKPDGDIAVDVQDCTSERIQKYKFAHWPIIRGVINFVDSLVLGTKTLMYSANFYAEETPEEQAEREGKARKKAAEKAEKYKAKGQDQKAQQVLDKCEKKLAKEAASGKESSDDDDWLMTVTVIVSLLFSIVLFMMAPYWISRLLGGVIHSETALLVIESAVKLVIFFAYLALIGQMKDIQRTFMYHGAEHKCINCVEHGLELTVDNVRTCSREHKRCGTSFLFLVMVVSIILIVLFSVPFFTVFHIYNTAVRVILRILLLPIVAGVAYEFIQLAGRTDSKFVNLLSRPGMMLQHMTTKEPDDSMIEVGIASVEAVFDWRKFENENFGTHYEAVESQEPKEAAAAAGPEVAAAQEVHEAV